MDNNMTHLTSEEKEILERLENYQIGDLDVVRQLLTTIDELRGQMRLKDISIDSYEKERDELALAHYKDFEARDRIIPQSLKIEPRFGSFCYGFDACHELMSAEVEHLHMEVDSYIKRRNELKEKLTAAQNENATLKLMNQNQAETIITEHARSARLLEALKQWAKNDCWCRLIQGRKCTPHKAIKAYEEGK